MKSVLLGLNIIKTYKHIISQFANKLKYELNKINKHIYDDLLYFKVQYYVLNFPIHKIIKIISKKYLKEIKKNIKYYTMVKEWDALTKECQYEIASLIYQNYFNELYAELKYTLKSNNNSKDSYQSFLIQYNDYNYR